MCVIWRARHNSNVDLRLRRANARASNPGTTHLINRKNGCCKPAGNHATACHLTPRYVALRNRAKSGRLRDTGLVHTATSGEQQVADFVGFLEAARQSLPLRQQQENSNKINRSLILT